MDLSSAVYWWEKWQLRILVLGSLFVQLFLFFSAWVRHLSIMRKLRVVVWVAYVGGDALAIYALATLFSSHKQQADDDGSSPLEVLWAPVLLIHLGGQIQISAYSLEDNELWKRHAITLVSQVTVALYVFCKWWSGEERLLQAAVLLFIIGIIKSAQKPWGLRNASFNYMLDSTVEAPRREGRVPSCWRWCISYGEDFCSPRGAVRSIWMMLKRGVEKEEAAQEEEAQHKRSLSLEEYVQQARKHVIDMEHGRVSTFLPFDYVQKMFVDLPIPYSDRLNELRYMLSLRAAAYSRLQRCLYYTYAFMYTTWRATVSSLGVFLLVLVPFLASASTVLFAMSHKDGHSKSDIWVTYVLFSCTAIHEFLYIVMPFLPSPCLEAYGYQTWNNMICQYSLLSFCSRKKKPTILMKLATFCCLQEYANKYWYVWQVPEAPQIIQLFRSHVTYGWTEFIHDAATYKSFNNRTGQLSLSSHNQLGWSLNFLFDESVLLWHLATDLCFHHGSTTLRGQEYAAKSRVMSNYMVYLLFNHPEMLIPGTRSDLVTAASDDIGLLLRGYQPPLLDERSVVQGVLRAAQFPMLYQGRIGSLIPNACKLVEELMELGIEEERWKVIQGVWVEKLCYSASRCRGYLHARSLGEGGEYLSYVWFLLSFMGMETLADRHQRSEPPQEEAAVECASTSQSGRAVVWE